jgi:hypothetical protein
VVFRGVTPALHVLDVVPRKGSMVAPAAVQALWSIALGASPRRALSTTAVPPVGACALLFLSGIRHHCVCRV